MAFSWYSIALLVLVGACMTVGAPNSTWPPFPSTSWTPSPSLPTSFSPSFTTSPPMVSRSSAIPTSAPPVTTAVPTTTPPVNNTNALNSTDAAVIVIDLDQCTQCRDNAKCSKAAGDGSPGTFCWNTLPTSTINTSSPFERVQPAPCCCPLQSTCLAVASSSCECLKSEPPIQPPQSSIALTVALCVGLVAVAVGCFVVWRLRRSMKARVPPGASTEYPIMKEI